MSTAAPWKTSSKEGRMASVTTTKIRHLKVKAARNQFLDSMVR
jgi:hypothetical protein